MTVSDDEEPNRADLRKMRDLKPAFQENGILTVGNSPSCNDGAAALLIMAEGEAARLGLTPMARIVGYAGAALAPEWFTIAPIEAFKRLGQKVNVNGGAVALGHPIGATGARILTTLLHAMEARGARRGLASLCIGGGEALAMIVER